MNAVRKWLGVFTRYIRDLILVVLLGVVFLVLDLFDVIHVFFPSFTLTQPLLISTFIIAFLIANIRIYGDQESRITELEATKVNALDSTIQEIERNRASAKHNAGIRGQTNSPGALAFIRFDGSICKDIILSGRFKFDYNVLEAAREYLQTINHLNSMMDNVEAATARFQNAAGMVDALC